MGNEASSLPTIPSTHGTKHDAPISSSQKVKSEENIEHFPDEIQRPFIGNRRKINSFDNELRVDDSEPNNKNFSDPVLSAAAVGASARKKTYAYQQKQEAIRRQQEEESRTQEQLRIQNEWSSSLRRFSRLAASTAGTFVQATAPVLKEAGTVIETSAKEFAHEVRTEWEKKKMDEGDRGEIVPTPRSTLIRNSDIDSMMQSTEEKQIEEKNDLADIDSVIQPTEEKQIGETNNLVYIDSMIQPTEEKQVEEKNNLVSDPGHVSIDSPQSAVENIAENDEQGTEEEIEAPCVGIVEKEKICEDEEAEAIFQESESVSIGAENTTEEISGRDLEPELSVTSHQADDRPSDEDRSNDVECLVGTDGGNASVAPEGSKDGIDEQPGSMGKDELNRAGKNLGAIIRESVNSLPDQGSTFDIASQKVRNILPFFQANTSSFFEATAGDGIASGVPLYDNEVLPNLLVRTQELFQNVALTASTLRSSGTPRSAPVRSRQPNYIERSVFDYEPQQIPKSVRSDTSSISTPDSLPCLLNQEGSDSFSSDGCDEAFLWDLYPPKRDLSPERYTVTVVTEGIDIPYHEGDVESSGDISGRLESPGSPIIDSVSFPLEPSPQSRRNKEPHRQMFELPNVSDTDSNLDLENETSVPRVTTIEVKPEALTLKWEKDSIGSFPGVPQTEDISDAVDRGEGIEAALLAFSPLASFDFLGKIDDLQATEDVGKELPSLIWSHLVASWKHQEIWKALNSSPCTIQVRHGLSSMDHKDQGSGSVSTSKFVLVVNRDSGSLEGGDDESEISAYKLLQESSGIMLEHMGDGGASLTGYLREIGPESFNKDPSPDDYLQPITKIEGDTEEGGDDASCLVASALKTREALESLVAAIVAFSSRRDENHYDGHDEYTTIMSSVDIKGVTAIRKKAARKYGGNISRVFDVLRAQVIFPDETSLIYGLWKLWSMRTKPANQGLTPSQSGGIEIIRLKNLFRTSPVGNACFQDLPTGYRHILINVRFGTGIIAELQFQLMDFFQILGTGGYQLHQDLVSKKNRGVTDPESTQNDVRSILSFLDVPCMTKSVLFNRTIEKTWSVHTSTQDTNTTSTITQVELASNPGSAIEPPTPGTKLVTVSKTQDTKKVSGSQLGPAPIGIAAIAAAAATAKHFGTSTGTMAGKPHTSTPGTKSVTVSETQDTKKVSGSQLGPAPVGIAAIAAAAAAGKNFGTSTVTTAAKPQTSTPGTKSVTVSKTQDINMVSGSQHGPAPVGIAAIAAAAAAAKNFGTSTVTTAGKPHTSTPGTEPVTVSKTQDTNMVSGSQHGPAPVGIAAIAAAAAAAKNFGKATVTTAGKPHTSTNSTSTMSGSAPFVAGTSTNANLEDSRTAPTDTDNRTSVGDAAKEADPGNQQGMVNRQLVDDISAIARDKVTTTSKDLEKMEQSLIIAAMKVGTKVVQASPRDFSSLYCMYILARRLSSISTQPLDADTAFPMKEIQVVATRLLIRGLAISNQAASVGIVGWMEYGMSHDLDRIFTLPLEVLRELASNLAENNDWDSACDVLGSLVLQCEQRLSADHPITLSSLMDLAGAYSMAGRNASFERIISRVSDLTTHFLSLHETLFFKNERRSANFSSNANKVTFDSREDSIEVMKAFASEFLQQLSRPFLQKISGNHPARLLNHSLAADSLIVLANCCSAINQRTPNQTTGPTSTKNGMKSPLYYWSLAYKHYQYAIRGWLQIGGTLSDPTVASAVYSCARCLRELGMLDQALKLLNTLMSTMKEYLLITRDDRACQDSRLRSQILVLVLWLAATLTVEQSPDERGRIRAMSLLHGASDTLRFILRYADDMDEATRLVCLDLYDCIEDEARVLVDPMCSVHGDHMPAVATKGEGVRDASRDNKLTTMRLKRWYQSAKSRLGQDESGSTGMTKPTAKIRLI